MTPTQEQFLAATQGYLDAMPDNFEGRDAAQSIATVLHYIAEAGEWEEEQIRAFCDVIAECVVIRQETMNRTAMG
jgi:hypothetical protein